jgi:fatty acid desaturase
MSTYRRIKAADLFTPQELERIRHPSDALGVLCVLHAWAVIAGAIALTAWSWWFLPLSIMLIGARQLGLAILMHDAAHGILARSKGLNEFLGQYLCAYPVFSDLKPYRGYHLKHHRHTQQPEDPDLTLSARFPITRTSFRRKIVRDLTGQTAFQQRRAQFANAFKSGKWATLAGQSGTNAVLLGALIAAGRPELYLLLWVLPLGTWFMAITRIRNIAEHAVVPDNDDPLRNARTTKASLLERAFIAPYWVNYHVEHHALFWVPCYRLAEMHRLLIAKGFGPKMEIRGGYLEVLRLATSKTGPDAGGHGDRTRRRGNAVFADPGPVQAG